MEELAERIHHNIEAIKLEMTAAARSVDRPAEDARLVVVTKAQPIATVEAVLQAGAAIIGENYPEESLPKMEAMRPRYKAEWHMIGHLQSRKVAIVADHFDCYQSLDRVEIALKLDAILAGRGRRLPVLLEFNSGGEGSKSGWDASEVQNWDGLVGIVRQICNLPHLEVRGLMTMPPLFEDPELVRPFFTRLRRLRDFLESSLPGCKLPELSMGTSADFRIAIQEGATLVRIGTAIVGPRPPRA